MVAISLISPNNDLITKMQKLTRTTSASRSYSFTARNWSTVFNPEKLTFFHCLRTKNATKKLLIQIERVSWNFFRSLSLTGKWEESASFSRPFLLGPARFTAQCFSALARTKSVLRLLVTWSWKFDEVKCFLAWPECEKSSPFRRTEATKCL